VTRERGRRWAAHAILAIACGAPCAISCATPTAAPEAKAPKQCDLQQLSMTIVAAANLNAGADGAHPVQLRIYQLKDDVRLLSADFEQIWKHDAQTLGPDLVGVAELPIYPDSRTEVKMERNPEALHVVGVAMFREPKGRTWYVSLELPPPPGKLPCDSCQGPDCEAKAAEGGGGSPRISFYLEGMRIDEGSAHAGDFPAAGRVRIVHLTPTTAAPPAPAGSAGAP
jgi:type VI secretion system VasD/TssJ family lipoprotein